MNSSVTERADSAALGVTIGPPWSTGVPGLRMTSAESVSTFKGTREGPVALRGRPGNLRAAQWPSAGVWDAGSPHALWTAAKASINGRA